MGKRNPEDQRQGDLFLLVVAISLFHKPKSMGTRATITISDKDERFDIYRHYDGYPNGPHGVIHDIRAAIDRAWPQPRFEAGDFAAATVAQMKQCPGSVYLTPEAKRHADRSFHYDVRFAENALRVIVHDYASRIDKVIPKWEGTIDEAVKHFKADEDYDGEPVFEHHTVTIPVEGVDVIANALDAAALDINQACKWRPDPDSKRALDKIRMAKALIGHTE